MTGIVIAHGGAVDVVNMNYSNWADAFSAICIITPTDDPLPSSITCGLSCHHGAATIDRMKLAVALAASCNQAAILEYDTLVWNLPDFVTSGELLCGRLFENGNPEFLAPQYAHSPWLGTKETWIRLLSSGNDMQSGWPDRWLCAAAYQDNIRLRSLDGFSCDWGWDEVVMENAIKARRDGARSIHGMKNLDMIKKLCQQS